MRTIQRATETRIFQRKELARLLGLEVSEKSKVTVEVHGEDVSVVVQDEKEVNHGLLRAIPGTGVAV